MADPAPAAPAFRCIDLGRPGCQAIELSDGRRLLMRPIQPGDADNLRRSFHTLSPMDVRMRFMHPLKELSPEYARRLCTIDPAGAFALVLVEARPPAEALILAVARTAVDADGEEAEFAIVLSPAIRRMGLGRHLMQALMDWARQRQLQALYGFILADNRPMLNLAAALGFALSPTDQDLGIVLARLALVPEKDLRLE